MKDKKYFSKMGVIFVWIGSTKLMKHLKNQLSLSCTEYHQVAKQIISDAL